MTYAGLPGDSSFDFGKITKRHFIKGYLKVIQYIDRPPFFVTHTLFITDGFQKLPGSSKIADLELILLRAH